MRQQVGALPVRWTGDEPRVLLVTSRETQRWIIPKGWRMRGRSNAEAAAQEALEEAGVRGRVRNKPIGRYVYAKRRPGGTEDCKITTYLLEVTDELDAFPEMAERQRSWFTIAEAEACADDEGLRDILRSLGPRLEALRSRGAKRRAKAAEKDAPPKVADAKSAPSGTPEPKPRSKKAPGGKASGAALGGKRSKRTKAAAATSPGVDAEAGSAVDGETAVAGETTADDAPPAVAPETDAAALEAQARKRNAGKVARVAGRRRRKAARKALTDLDDTPQAAE